jgi:hypothetical protein
MGDTLLVKDEGASVEAKHRPQQEGGKADVTGQDKQIDKRPPTFGIRFEKAAPGRCPGEKKQKSDKENPIQSTSPEDGLAEVRPRFHFHCITIVTRLTKVALKYRIWCS